MSSLDGQDTDAEEAQGDDDGGDAAASDVTGRRLSAGQSGSMAPAQVGPAHRTARTKKHAARGVGFCAESSVIIQLNLLLMGNKKHIKTSNGNKNTFENMTSV